MARYTVQTAAGPKRKTIYGKTREDVADKLAEALANRSKGLLFDAGNMTLGEYLGRWLTECVRETVRECTYRRYESIVRVNLVPDIGRIKLKSLTPA
ncbi:MAG: site-specific integrase, partial [Rubrobacteraceae bacterium]|nr:site-specific integrase [Rubrobacteraceae bacterium]